MKSLFQICRNEGIGRKLPTARSVALGRWWFGALIVICLFASGSLSAQEFTLDCATMIAGGGHSAGGDFELSGGAGESTAGDLQGGDFAVSGGFWSLMAALETPGAPSLQIAVDRGDVVISWPADGTGDFRLEETSTLANAGSWTPVGATPELHDGMSIVRLPLASGVHLYRLHRK